MKSKKQKKIAPPNFLRGLVLIIVSITALILISSWSIINYDVEKLVASRTSEYAHSIALIAANSSADALLSDDKLQLNMLVENVAKDPYIKSATVFAEDGQVFAQYPEEENTDLEQLETSNSAPETSSIVSNSGNIEAQKAIKYIESEANIPFVEPIIYQGVTSGWFKIVIHRGKLESSFRQSVSHSKNIIILIAILLLSALISIIIKYEQQIKELVSFNHRLIQVNSQVLPTNKQDWVGRIKELSETQFYNLPENKQLPTNEAPWISSKRLNNTLFCYCQFAMQEQEDDETASSLTLAEKYLQSAIQTHGLHSQGDILSGCLIPLITSSSKQEDIAVIIGLTHLIKELLGSLSLPIKMKAFIGSGTILVLENNRAEVSGFSLSNRLLNQINKLSSHTSFGDIVFVNFELDELTPMGEFKLVESPTQGTSIQLLNANEAIQQQINRQVSYLKSN